MSCCLIVCFYNGNRRNNQESYFTDYLNLQKQNLKKLKHSLDKIIFVISEDTRNEIKIEENQQENITYLYRPNINYSFGGWVDTMLQFTYDYYILLEDDYYFIQDHFDQILIKSYNEKNSDYLVTWRNKKDHTRFNGELISTIGIISLNNFNKYRSHFNFFNRTNIGIRGINTFLKTFNSISSLDYHFNLFPYYHDEIIMYGYDDTKTNQQNTNRILLCCYQYYLLNKIYEK